MNVLYYVWDLIQKVNVFGRVSKLEKCVDQSFQNDHALVQAVNRHADMIDVLSTNVEEVSEYIDSSEQILDEERSLYMGPFPFSKSVLLHKDTELMSMVDLKFTTPEKWWWPDCLM